MTSPRSPAATTCDFLVLGAGLSGLAAARGLGTRALVLEQDVRPGGLARSESIDGYLFDHAIHVLYFPDEAMRARVFALRDHHLAPCPPEAWVETAQGVARFPIQLHLGALAPAFVERCVGELERVLKAPPGGSRRAGSSGTSCAPTSRRSCAARARRTPRSAATTPMVGIRGHRGAWTSAGLLSTLALALPALPASQLVLIYALVLLAACGAARWLAYHTEPRLPGWSRSRAKP